MQYRNLLDLSDEIDLIVDTFELNAFLEESFSIDFLERRYDLNRNVEREIEIQDAEDEVSEKISSEIQKRIDFLGDSYPFIYNAAGSLQLKKSRSNGGNYYLFCLLLSITTSKEIAYKITSTDRQLFEKCSVFSLSGLHSMNAVHFGFPIKANDDEVDDQATHQKIPDFLKALKEVFEVHIKAGKVSDQYQYSADSYIKDGGIDIICWNPVHLPLGTVRLGQVASGTNWKNKNICILKSYKYISRWFSVQPLVEFSADLIIPFNIEDKNIEHASLTMDCVILCRKKASLCLDKCFPLITQGHINSSLLPLGSLTELDKRVMSVKVQLLTA